MKPAITHEQRALVRNVKRLPGESSRSFSARRRWLVSRLALTPTMEQRRLLPLFNLDYPCPIGTNFLAEKHGVSAALAEELERAAAYRFVSNIKRGMRGCLVWTGPVYQHGYGMFSLSSLGEKMPIMLAHRFALLKWLAVLPAEAFGDKCMVLHHCDNKVCVNPSHLRLGSNAENMKDAVDRKRLPLAVYNKLYPKWLREEWPEMKRRIIEEGFDPCA